MYSCALSCVFRSRISYIPLSTQYGSSIAVTWNWNTVQVIQDKPMVMQESFLEHF